MPRRLLKLTSRLTLSTLSTLSALSTLSTLSTLGVHCFSRNLSQLLSLEPSTPWVRSANSLGLVA